MTSVAPAAAEGTAKLSIGEVLRAALPRHASNHQLPQHHWRTLRTLMACGTPALGGHTYRCEACGRDHFVPHSCRNRHCPACQRMLGYKWMEKQLQLLLPIPYFHLVFTLPHALNGLVRQNQAVVYKLLFDCAAATLLEFGHRRFKAQLGMTMVLHTWSQTLLDHYHVHAIVTGGGLSLDASAFGIAKDYWLFPAKALSKVFRAKFRDGLIGLRKKAKLSFHGELASLEAETDFSRLIKEACRQRWVVYAKRPFAGPREVLAYLARYTHRVGISERRLKALDARSGAVTFAYKDYADGSKQKEMTLSADEFVRRFRLHLLPARFVKVRHYGILSNRNRQRKIAQAKSLLPTIDVPPPATRAEGDPTEHRCPYCQSTRLVLLTITHRPANQIEAAIIASIPDTS
jgi:Putative transposase/Transposase zinc-binding domain